MTLSSLLVSVLVLRGREGRLGPCLCGGLTNHPALPGTESFWAKPRQVPGRVDQPGRVSVVDLITGLPIPHVLVSGRRSPPNRRDQA